MPALAAPDPRIHRLRSRSLVVIAVIAVFAALRATADVTLPLAFAVFLVAVFWPLQRRLQPRIGGWPAALVCMAACLLAVGLIGYGLWESAEMFAERIRAHATRMETVERDLRARGLPDLRGVIRSGAARDQALAFAERLAASAGAFVLLFAFFGLGLLEVRDYRHKVGQALGGPARLEAWAAPARRIGDDLQRYIVVRTVVGLITGALVTLVTWALGLDLPLVWGLMNFLLNYIPTLGSIVGVFPPVAFALLQFDDPWRWLAVLAGVAGVQLVMGAFVDPRLQGRYLRLSPLVVLVAVTFWGWVWGIAGAFISVPLTVAGVIVCREFPRTRWIAILLAEWEPEEGPEPEGAPHPGPGAIPALPP